MLVMEQAKTLTPINQEELEMKGTVVSNVPKLLESRGWGAMDLVRRAGLGVDTSYRLARGEIDFTIQTLGRLCEVFGVAVNKIVEYVPPED